MFRSQDIFVFLWNPPKSKSFSVLNIYTLNIKNTVTSYLANWYNQEQKKD